MEVDVSNRVSSMALNYEMPTWFMLRILISSTFKDMMSERDILIRYVFPELRRRAASVFAKIVEVDLRWGITEADSASKKKMASDSNSRDSININDLPDEALAAVFSFLSQNNLGQIARVCKKWNRATRYSTLWKKVEVKFDPSHSSQKRVTEQLVRSLPANVTEIHFDFINFSSWIAGVDFRNLGLKLGRQCPRLQSVLLKDGVLSNSLGCVIETCCHQLPKVKTLLLRNIKFVGRKVEFSGTSNIQILELSGRNVGKPLRPLNFRQMPALKELYLYGSFDCYPWLSEDTVLNKGGSVIGQLTVLHVGFVANGNIFPAIKTQCHRIRELYLCNAGIRDADLIFNPSTFPQLTTICLRGSPVTATGVASLSQSCPSLVTIFVEDDLADSFVGRMASIVKGNGACFHHLKFTCL